MSAVWPVVKKAAPREGAEILPITFVNREVKAPYIQAAVPHGFRVATEAECSLAASRDLNFVNELWKGGPAWVMRSTKRHPYPARIAFLKEEGLIIVLAVDRVTASARVAIVPEKITELPTQKKVVDLTQQKRD